MPFTLTHQFYHFLHFFVFSLIPSVCIHTHMHMYGVCVCMVLSLYIDMSISIHICTQVLYILFIFPKPFEGRFHASCPLIFLCIFPKNKKILLHNHSYQFRKSIINKIFLFNLQPTFQFHQLSQLGPLEKFSPLIQDPVQSHLLHLITVPLNLLSSRTLP